MLELGLFDVRDFKNPVSARPYIIVYNNVDRYVGGIKAQHYCAQHLYELTERFVTLTAWRPGTLTASYLFANKVAQSGELLYLFEKK